MRQVDYENIDEYIALFPEEVQAKLQELRKAIRDSAPGAVEAISYRMPTYKLNGNLVHFAAFKDHISLFPTASGIEAFKDRITAYETSKGTIHFPLKEPIPLSLVKEIVEYRVRENMSKKRRK